MRYIKRVLLLIMSLVLILSLASCVEKNETNEDGKQIPIYEGMTVSSTDQATEKEIYNKLTTSKKVFKLEKSLKKNVNVDVEDKVYQADLGEEILITIHISNPDNFEILSFTINGEKYTSYMFERGSDMKNIIIKYNVGRVSGEQEYTIDAIKYVDKSAIKDVIIRGDKTIKVVVSEFEHEANCKHDNPEKITIYEAVAATCQSEGATEGKKCHLCDTVVVEPTVVPKLACNPGEWIVDKLATDTRDGRRHTECTACGKVVSEEDIYAPRSQGLDYALNGDGATCTVTGMGECTDDNLIIPEYINGYKVVAIGDNAFEGTAIKKLVITKFVTKIGASAFANCDLVEEITFFPSVKVIGEDGFYNCDSLESIYYMGEVVDWCSIDFADAWSNPLGFGKKIYFNDEFIIELVIPDSVTNIDNHAFSGCNQITSLKIGNGVVVIGEQAFSGCRSLSDITFGNSVKIIDSFAFEVSAITSIVIPESVEFIGYETFMACRYLKNVMIESSKIHVSTGAFLDCYALEYNEYNNAYYLGNEENPYCVFVSLVDKTATSLELAESTKAIAGDAFKYCTGLESVTLPNCVIRLDRYMFYGCTNLRKVVLSDSVVDIIDNTFFMCESLEEIYISASVENIVQGAFENCNPAVKIIVDENNQYYKSIDGNLYTKDGATLIRAAA